MIKNIIVLSHNGESEIQSIKNYCNAKNIQIEKEFVDLSDGKYGSLIKYLQANEKNRKYINIISISPQTIFYKFNWFIKLLQINWVKYEFISNKIPILYQINDCNNTKNVKLEDVFKILHSRMNNFSMTLKNKDETTTMNLAIFEFIRIKFSKALQFSESFKMLHNGQFLISSASILRTFIDLSVKTFAPFCVNEEDFLPAIITSGGAKEYCQPNGRELEISNDMINKLKLKIKKDEYKLLQKNDKNIMKYLEHYPKVKNMENNSYTNYVESLSDIYSYLCHFIHGKTGQSIYDCFGISIDPERKVITAPISS